MYHTLILCKTKILSLVVAQTLARFSLKWNPAYAGGAKSVSYSVFMTTDSVGTIQTWTLATTTSATSYEAQYSIGSEYSVRVSATNLAGTSSPIRGGLAVIGTWFKNAF